MARVKELVAKNTDDKEIVNNVKETYAHARKSIIAGKQERYTKVMALLYTREKDGSINFHDPYQLVVILNETPRGKRQGMQTIVNLANQFSRRARCY